MINQNFLDMVPPGTTKAVGLEWLTDHIGVECDEVELYIFGDSWNGLPMPAITDLPFSFPWSPEEVVAADEVIDSVAEVLPGLIEEG